MITLRTIPFLFWIYCAGSKSPVLSGLHSQLSSRHPHLAPSKINHFLHVALTEAAREEGIPLHDLSCVRDFSGCPEDWVDVGDGKNCDVPTGYTGPCSSIDLDGKTPLERSQAASKCHARFPCIDAASVNYDDACPEGWQKEGNVCVASGQYNGPCIRRYELGDDRLRKQQFARSCEANWPALSQRGYSFLENPNFGDRLKNGIFATGPIRSPPKATLNVISSENISAAQQIGSAIEVENKIKYLKKKFEQGLSALENGF